MFCNYLILLYANSIQMADLDFFDSLTIKDDRQNAKKYLTLRYVVKTRFIHLVSLQQSQPAFQNPFFLSLKENPD